MQPNPIADTSRPPLPSLRFSMALPHSVSDPARPDKKLEHLPVNPRHPSSLSVLAEAGGVRGGGVGTDPDVEDGVVEDPVARDSAPVTPVLGPEREPDLLGGARREGDTLEALELSDGS